MRNNCSKIRIVALLMVMLLGAINTWAIELLRKDAMICLAHRNLSAHIEGGNCTWTEGTNGASDGTCRYTWSGNTNNLVRLYSFGDNLKDVINYKCIIVKTKNLTGTYRIVVRSRINNQDHTFVYGGISTSGVVAVPLDNRNGWTENYNPITLATFNSMRQNLKDLCIGGFSQSGSLDFMEIALAKRIRTVNWNQDGHIELTYNDFPTSQDNLTRNGNNFVNAGGWCGLTLSFDSELETSSFYVDGEYYNAEGQKTVTPDAPFLNNFLAIDMDGFHYKSKALRTNIAHSKMADFQVLFQDAGNMHIYKVILRHKNVHIVSFDSDGGSECATQEVYNKAVTLPTPTKSSCVFKGWYDENGNKVGDGGASYTPTEALVSLKAKWEENKLGNENTEVNTMFTDSYEITNNHQREFTFLTSGNSSSKGWVLWATRNARTANNRSDYFCMDLAPSIKMYETGISALGEPEEMSIYIKNGDNLEPLSTDEQWAQFRNDIANRCYVRVKVANYDGIITVYSVMKKDNRTYVYATKYDKHDSYAGTINVFFTPDHIVLNRFIANNSVYTRKVSVGGISYPANTEERYKTCSVAITTLDGYDLPAGTAVGEGDTVTYHAIPGRKWEFVKWGNSGEYANPRNIVLKNADIYPYADFQRPANIAFFDPATDRVFFEDFEHLDELRVAKREIRDKDGNLIRTDEATNSGIEIVTEESDMAAYEATPEHDKYYYQGKYLNYGGKGRVLNDPVFGKYYQNLADSTDEYTKSVAQNFLRIILTDEQREKIGSGICRYDNVHWKEEQDRSATIGFWVNAKIANKYELPLERGSMFCVFSNERFRKADAGSIETGQEPRFMFDLACNGTTYSNMPKSIAGENGGPLIDYDNFFFYGDTVPLTNTPTPSLFGEKFYKNAQDQTTSKFYDDDQWHYVAYVATNGLKTVTLFVDGEECGKMDMTTLGEGLKDFNVEGDFSGRTFYLRNIVLGGFTPHGLFFQKEYYEDAALAFDDIAIYSRALNADEIYDIMEDKQLKRDEWHFTTTLKADGMAEKNLSRLDASTWRGSNGVYTLNRNITKSELQIGHETIFSTEGLKFTGATGQIIIDQKNGLIGLKRGAEIYVPDLNRGENVYFVVKSGDPEKYPLDPYDLWPINDPCELRTRGVSLYGIQGKEDFSVFTGYKNNNISSQSYGFRVYSHGTIAAYNTAYTGYPHNNNNNNNVLWISDVFISPYSLTYTDDSRKVNSINTKNYTRRVIHVDVERNDDKYEFTQPTLPVLIITDGTSTKNEKVSDYSKANFDSGAKSCYIRFSSSAPHIANVSQSGKVTVTGIAGYATIKAELVFDNLYDGCISTAYQIRVENTPKTHHVEENVKYDVAEKETVKAKDGSDAITMSLGGWAYTANAYKGTVGDVMDNNGSATDSWTKGFVHNERNDVTPIDGFSTYSQGSQNAKSESYGNDDGRYIPTTQVVRNVTPWTLPCRGSYLKFDAEKTGVLTVYVLQSGNLDKSDINNDYSDQIHWRPVYITNERGVCVPRVQYDTNSKISENDNFFKEGRRRAQFIEEIEGTYNQRLKDALLDWKGSNYDRFKLLLDHWENQGWKQKVIKTGDGGYMIMSKGIVRYSFNVVPGQTYYVFSNDTKIGYAGYNFEEGKILFDNASDSYDTNPMYSAAVTTTPVVYKDELNFDPQLPEGINNMFSVPVEIQRSFKANTWSSICLPFSINRKQLEENFGEGTSVVLAKQVINHGYDKGRLELIWHVNQDIIAGYPYFILPTKNVAKIKVNVPYRKDQERYLSNPYLAVSSNGTSLAHKANYSDYCYEEYPYVFEGNFKDEVLPAGSYVMSNNGVLTRLKSSVPAKPFRAYLRNVGNGANAKPLTTMGFSDSEGETTSVEEILQDNGIILESSDVYGVNGVKVRSNTHSLEGLSKGVYVVNGKKYVVK